ncbi:hypothetical protein GSI_12322 [Ganoderma sinense ZZ0214-1]|uniref:Uncharacterized protein n=1 Tax=Ganoderma sinense ZZ0214-1 TaxID=1077348 RepID=A0A2G8RYJ9_9APHY|nr:hypothetical protein GSI_12322 [Ganoderma sinense ZZ0214-1]
MENFTSSETIQPIGHELYTEHDIVLWHTVSLLLQSVLFGAFAVTYATARSALLKGSGPFLHVEQRNIVYLRAITAMLGFAFANLAMSFMATLLPAAGYEGKLDIPYKTFRDKYFLFLSVNGIQFYLYVTQTAIAGGLLTYILCIKSDGNPKAYSHAALCSVLGTLFGYFAFRDGLWAFQFLFFTTVGVNLLSSGPMMQASLRGTEIVRKPWDWHPRALVAFFCSKEFTDATVQSAAPYSLASLLLPVTFLVDTNILFYTAMSVLSPLMGIVFSFAVVGWSRAGGANEPYVPWTRQSQGRPPMSDTGYISLTAPLDRSPDLALYGVTR